MKRKNLCADALYSRVKSVFHRAPEHRKNLENIKIPLPDALMSGLAIFALKFPSLLQFDEAKKDEEKRANLHNLFSIGSIPSDTQTREILDPVDPEHIRPAFKKVFTELQRGNELQKFQYLDGHYLLALDGTGDFGSTKVSCPHCIQKKLRSGETEYYHQLLGASIVHPDIKQVIPFCPEAILNQDGNKKQDCERESAKRWIEKFRDDHPRLKTIMVEDALASNAPHIKTLMEHNIRYILGVKEKGNKALFEQVEINDKHGLLKEYEYYTIIGDKIKKKVTHKFKYLNGLSLNHANPDIKVNFVDYREIKEYLNPEEDKKGIGTKIVHFSWITDLKIIQDNVVQIMRAGRSRWRIENENFKTLKEKTAYNFEHSYGHGKENLCTIFAYLTVLSFLIDQTQEIACSLFKKALAGVNGTKRELWGKVKNLIAEVSFTNWEAFIKLLAGEAKLVVDSS